MSGDTGIAQKISDYLAGNLPVSEFSDWITVHTWSLDDEPVDTQRVGYGALRLVSEAENGDWTEDELRHRLATLLHPGSAGEGFLDKLADAQSEASRHAPSEDQQVAALIRYAAFTVGSSETALSNGPSSLRQPRGESETQSPPEAELAAC
jgi:hypothetical protein